MISFYYLYKEQIKQFFIWMSFTVLAYVLAFSLFGVGNLFSNMGEWVRNVINYQHYSNIPAIFPSNWSIANFIALIGWFFTRVIKTNFTFPHTLVSTISAAFLILSLLTIFLRRSSLSKIQVLILLSLISMLTPGVSFSYYLAVLIPPILIFSYSAINGMSTRSGMDGPADLEIHDGIRQLFLSRNRQLSFLLMALTCLVSWPLTWLLLSPPFTGLRDNIGVMWTPGLGFLILWYFMILFSERERTDKQLIGRIKGII